MYVLRCTCTSHDKVEIQIIFGTVQCIFKLFLGQCSGDSDYFWGSIVEIQIIFGAVQGRSNIFGIVQWRMEIQIIFWDSVVEVQIIFGQCSGDYFWDSVVQITFGTVQWRLRFYGDSVIIFGTVQCGIHQITTNVHSKCKKYHSSVGEIQRWRGNNMTI